MLFSPFLLCFWFMGKPWHTASRKKIKYLVVVSGAATNYGKIFYLPNPPVVSSILYKSCDRTVERLCPKSVRCSLLLDTKKPAGSIIGNQRVRFLSHFG